MNRSTPAFWPCLIPALFAVLLLAACGGPRLADRYQPGASEISLWRGERIPLDPAWHYLGDKRLPVRGALWTGNLVPSDQVETLIFTQATDSGTAIMLLSRIDKTGGIEVFRPLGGIKTELAGQAYRQVRYGLDANSADSEYSAYFSTVRQAGLPLAPRYTARIFDRLPLDTVLIRIMELTPGMANQPLPSYGRLYPQERRETLPRHFF